jgi:preprotein translocase subunit SecB
MTPEPPLSPLQLKEHRFTHLRVTSIEGGSPTAEPSLKPGIWYESVPNTADQWKLVLTLQLASADPAKPYAYEAEIKIQGLVQVKDGFMQAKKEQLALVNGLSILYSAAREMLLNITSRSAYGAVSLPTLSFVALVAQAMKQKEQPQPQPQPAQAPAPA